MRFIMLERVYGAAVQDSMEVCHCLPTFACLYSMQHTWKCCACGLFKGYHVGIAVSTLKGLGCVLAPLLHPCAPPPFPVLAHCPHRKGGDAAGEDDE